MVLYIGYITNIFSQRWHGMGPNICVFTDKYFTYYLLIQQVCV